MDERRKTHRLPINIKLTIESLYKQGEEKIENIGDVIQVVDISKGGIAFEVNDDLPLDFYFNSRIIIDEEKSFFSVLKIIRKIELEKGYHYGCEFVGLANVLSDSIDIYEKEISEC
ncbi:PilZ domain-containing protein [Clostridiaceae bacterium HSG29]|nr:PilZ domain-containing protein [Clostridiaceae bacterium HSG29]